MTTQDYAKYKNNARVVRFPFRDYMVEAVFNTPTRKWELFLDMQEKGRPIARPCFIHLGSRIFDPIDDDIGVVRNLLEDWIAELAVDLERRYHGQFAFDLAMFLSGHEEDLKSDGLYDPEATEEEHEPTRTPQERVHLSMERLFPGNVLLRLDLTARKRWVEGDLAMTVTPTLGGETVLFVFAPSSQAADLDEVVVGKALEGWHIVVTSTEDDDYELRVPISHGIAVFPLVRPGVDLIYCYERPETS